MQKIPITTILIIGLAVLLTLQLNSCFSKARKSEEMIRNEERLKYLEQQRLRDSAELMARLNTIDTLISYSQQRFDDLESKKQPIKYAIIKDRAAVSSFDKEQLRAAGSDYYRKYGQ